MKTKELINKLESIKEGVKATLTPNKHYVVATLDNETIARVPVDSVGGIKVDFERSLTLEDKEAMSLIDNCSRYASTPLFLRGAVQ